jgi:hypothetical protein
MMVIKVIIETDVTMFIFVFFLMVVISVVRFVGNRQRIAARVLSNVGACMGSAHSQAVNWAASTTSGNPSGIS